MSSVDSPLRVGFYVLDGFSMMCFANAVEPMRAVNLMLGGPIEGRQPAFERLVITYRAQPVSSSSNLVLMADSAADECPPLDWLVVIASYDYQRYLQPPILKEIRQLARAAKLVAGLDTGSWLLAEAGMLDGYAATIHWQEMALFAEQFEQVELVDQRFVIDRQRVSAGGAMATLDLMLALIRHQFDEQLFFDVRHLFLYDAEHPADQRQTRYRILQETAPALHAAMTLMESHLESPLALSAIADQISVSPRSLNRLFQRHLQTSPGNYYLKLRLNSARHLILETRLKLTEIALRSGFNSQQSLSSAFRRAFSVSPSQARLGKRLH